MHCPHRNSKVDRNDRFYRNCGRSVLGVAERPGSPTEIELSKCALPLRCLSSKLATGELPVTRRMLEYRGSARELRRGFQFKSV